MEGPFGVSIPVLYGIENWGSGYFDVNASGHLMVKPFRSGPGIDLYQVVEDLAKRRCPAPVLLRFPQILETQVRILHQAFQSAITEFQYGAPYKGVFPMKVNHRRDVIEELLRVGSRYDFGLEVGSKAELYIALSVHQPEESLLICNGFKDDSFIEMAFWGLKAGKRIVIVIEQVREIVSILKMVDATGITPMLGLRGRLYSKGSGKWEESGGETSKFGLSTVEMIDLRPDPPRARARGVLEDAPLPHRQPDHRHPEDQGGREGSKPRLREDPEDEGPGRVPERRRRSRYRLRRLQDAIGLERELHGPGVRQRRRLHDQRDLRRRGRPCSDDRLRERPGADRLPLAGRHDLRKSKRRERGRAARHAERRAGQSGPHRALRDRARHQREELPRVLSRRDPAAGGALQPLRPRLSQPRGPRPRGGPLRRDLHPRASGSRSRRTT